MTTNDIAAFAGDLPRGAFCFPLPMSHVPYRVYMVSHSATSLFERTGEIINHLLMNEMQAIMGEQQWASESSPWPSGLYTVRCILPSSSFVRDQNVFALSHPILIMYSILLYLGSLAASRRIIISYNPFRATFEGCPRPLSITSLKPTILSAGLVPSWNNSQCLR